jgi:hypothetical protein
MSSILQIIKYLTRKIISVPDDLDPALVPLPDEPSLLYMLPGELLQMISDFLPVSSASCLILCSRELLGTLGNRSWHLLRSEDQVVQRKHFLAVLERDLPDRQLCHHCSLFHPVEQDKGPNTEWTPRRVPECVRRNGFVFITTSFKIRFEHAQLLMNQYRFGRAYNLQMLSNTDLMSLQDTRREIVTWAEIVAGELLIRMTTKLCLHCTWDIQFIQSRILTPCHHLDRYEILWETILCRVSHADNEPCKDCAKWKSCRGCATWFLVDISEHENSDIEIRIDVNKYLGPCETPFDPKWRNQTDPSTECRTESTIMCPPILGRPSGKVHPAGFRS